MADVFDGSDLRDLDDLRTAVDVVRDAIDSSVHDEHAGAGALGDASRRIHLRLAEAMGEERAVRALAGLTYGLSIDSSTSLRTWSDGAADRMVRMLKADGRLVPGGEDE